MRPNIDMIHDENLRDPDIVESTVVRHGLEAVRNFARKARAACSVSNLLGDMTALNGMNTIQPPREGSDKKGQDYPLAGLFKD